MTYIYKRLVCCICAAAAALCMSAVPASALDTADTLCTANAQTVLMLAEDTENGNDADDSKTTMEERTGSGWQIIACLGGGVLVIIAIISLLADGKKK